VFKNYGEKINQNCPVRRPDEEQMSVKVNGVSTANEYILTTAVGPGHLAVVP
jgi:hypothetical protein